MGDIENGSKAVHMRLLSGQKDKNSSTSSQSIDNAGSVALKSDFEIVDVETTFIDLLCKNPQIRNFAYFCGMSAPTLSLDMTWYQCLAFLWSWLIKIGFIASIVITIIGANYQRTSTKLKSPGDSLFFAAQILYIVQLFTMIPIMFHVQWKVRKYTVLDFAKSGIFLDIPGLLKEIYILVAIYFLSFLIATSLFEKQYGGCPGHWFDQFVVLPMSLYEVFIYFIMRLDYLKVHEIFRHHLVADAAQGKLTFSKYESMRSFVNSLIDSHFVPFSLFVFASLLSCTDLLLNFVLYVVMNHFNNHRITILISFFMFIMFQGKDVFFLFSIVWKVSSINENSIVLTQKLCDNQPNHDTIKIFMNQTFQPLLYKFFGVIAVYRNEFIVGLLGYTVSFIATYLTSVYKSRENNV